MPQRATKTQLKLTGKQKIFIRKYLQIGVAKTAAKLAGYSEKSCEHIGWELLQNPRVRSEINRLNKIAETKAVINKETLLQKTEIVMQRALHGEPIYDEDGEVIEIVGQDDDMVLKVIDRQARMLSIGGYGKTELNIDNRTQIQNNYRYDIKSLSSDDRNSLLVLLAKCRVKTEEELAIESPPKSKLLEENSEVKENITKDSESVTYGNETGDD